MANNKIEFKSKFKCFSYIFNFNFFLAILLIYFEYLNYIETINVSVSTKCKVGEFYDINKYKCALCPENMVPSKDGKNF
jgi:hypothetical protein